MKNMLGLTLGLVMLAGSVYAACFGPFCYDDVSAQINAATLHQGDVGLPSKAKATLIAQTPLAAGQMIYCNDCTSSLDAVCISTGTGTGAYVKLSSRTVRCQD